LAQGDIGGSAVGATAGIIAAVLGASYYSLVVQVTVTDLVTGIILLIAAKGPMPNRDFRELLTLLPFGVRIFATNGLAYLSRNVDNVLVGRYLGTSSLSYYSMAYRVLVIPVQLLGQTVNRVLFPVFSRLADKREEVARTLITSTEMLALAALPLMAFVACSSHELVLIGLGHAWLPAAPLITVLALAGARETVFYITPALMTGMGRAAMNLRFEIVSTGVQLTGIVIGLQFGVLGVASGYAIAGLALTPLPMFIQRRLTGVSLIQQLGAFWPAFDASLWASGAYLLLRYAHLPTVAQLLAGFVVYTAVAILILTTFHREPALRTLRRLNVIRHRRAERRHA
jgi:PST family polysaccharide transporter